ALVRGEWKPEDAVAVRVHEPLSVLDLLDVSTTGHAWPLPAALAELQRAPCGVAVLLNCGEDAAGLLQRLQPEQQNAAPAAKIMDLRTYGVGAQILRDLGVQRMRLLGNPRRMPSMTGYGLEVTGFMAAGERA
ncbi:MAG: bifunctional 3,4-dihydroxy-2-butanone-4-phosphate synthase/GTP cyclohydrolase II, partial [Burkholderiaceae bacterium]|nr:bifunctional 3,4-dihydroxy-2-butanone-4-phosphate synthase/GTP cyclohydrolase II [Burkholderiaceae bacterium]